jgi:hypothetical protein
MGLDVCIKARQKALGSFSLTSHRLNLHQQPLLQIPYQTFQTITQHNMSTTNGTISQDIPQKETTPGDTDPKSTIPQDTKVDLPADEDFDVVEITSSKGVKYRIGRPKGSPDTKPPTVEALHGPPFSRSVYWQVNNSGTTDTNFTQSTGISQWNVSDSGLLLKYRLMFYTDQSFDYWFSDETGDAYECNVFLTGWHYVEYYSDKPNIAYISGS